MNAIIFIIFYVFALIFETSFINRFFSFPVPLSFWSFIFFSVILPRDRLLYFGAPALFLSSIFFSEFFGFPVIILLGTAVVFLVKSVKGIRREFSAAIISLALAGIYEIPHLFEYASGRYPAPVLLNETAVNLAFVSVMILLYFVSVRINEGVRRYGI